MVLDSATDRPGAAPAVTVSVVTPTYNRREQAIRSITSVAEQALDEPFEIVVVSDGSTDGTVDALRELTFDVPLTVIEQDNGGPAKARNTGVEAARGSLVIFIDDDLVATDGLLQAHLDAHRREGDGVVVVGPMVDPPDHELEPWVAWEQVMLRKQYDAMDAGEYDATARQFYTGNASVARAALLAAGGFDETFRRAEDVELAYRLADSGSRFLYVREAVGHHYAQRSYGAWRRAAYAYGRNDVIFARDRGREWILPFMAWKLGAHNPLLRALIVLCILIDPLRVGATTLLGWAARILGRVGVRPGAQVALSGVYGIEYHCGAADELGGSRAFLTEMRSHRKRST